MRVLERSATTLAVAIDVSLYPEDVVFKCFYWYGDKYDVTIDRGAGGPELVVRLAMKDGPLAEEALRQLESKIQRDLVDFKTRDIVAKETRIIRELLIAKAFAHSDDLDSPPPGSVESHD